MKLQPTAGIFRFNLAWPNLSPQHCVGNGGSLAAPIRILVCWQKMLWLVSQSSGAAFNSTLKSLKSSAKDKLIAASLITFVLFGNRIALDKLASFSV